MHIVLVGMNHRTAPLEVRERLAMNKGEMEQAGNDLRCTGLVSECVVVSTCNRTELYAIMPESSGTPLIDFLCMYRSLDPADLVCHFYSHADEAAVEQLFRVASGIDSMILGEAQVLGQIKDAYRIALEAGNTERVLNTLFRAAITAGKRGRAETQIGRGAVSVSHAAVELAGKIFGDLEGHSVLILGAGEMSEITAKLLSSAGVKSIIVSNRTFQRAEELAKQIGGQAIHYDRFEEALHSANIVISSTGSPQAIIHKEMIREAMRHRRGRPLFLIDIAVPRDIDSEVGDLDNVFLYNIDDLQLVVDRNLTEREKEIEKVEAILDEEKSKFLHWYGSLDAIPTIAELQLRLEEIRRAEMQRFSPDLSKLSDEDQRLVDLITQGLVKRILKEPMSQLKDAARNGNGVAPVEAARYLFGLDRGQGSPVEKSEE